MKQLILKFFLAGGVISATLLYSSQEKIAPDQENSMADQTLYNQQICNDYDSRTGPITCGANDKEVCEYIEQQKEFALIIWLRELEITLFLKLIYLKECLGQCKETFDAWLRKLTAMPY